jgi:hypothetical protein
MKIVAVITPHWHTFRRYAMEKGLVPVNGSRTLGQDADGNKYRMVHTVEQIYGIDWDEFVLQYDSYDCPKILKILESIQESCRHVCVIRRHHESN